VTKRARDAVFALFSVAVIGATTLTLIQLAPSTQQQEQQQEFKRSAPAWPPNALGRAVG
jgi:hypothetical protein